MDRETMIWQRARSDYMYSSLPEDKHFDELTKEEQRIYYRSAESELSSEDAFASFDDDCDDDDYYDDCDNYYEYYEDE